MVVVVLAAREWRRKRCGEGAALRRVVLLATTEALWMSSGLLSRLLKRALAQAETKQVRSRSTEVMGKRMEQGHRWTVAGGNLISPDSCSAGI